MIFCFGGKACNRALLARTPRDEVSTKINNIDSSGFTVIMIASPIRIRESIETVRGMERKMKTKV